MEAEIKAQIPGVDQVISEYAIVDFSWAVRFESLIDDVHALGISQSCL